MPGRTKKPSSKFRFMEEANAEEEAKQKQFAADAPLRAAKKRERERKKRDKEREKERKKNGRGKKGTAKSNDGIRRPLSAYMYYASEKRSIVMYENPDASFGEIGRILGTWWQDCTDWERVRYHEMAARDTARYHREVQESGGVVKPKKQKVNKEPVEKKVKKSVKKVKSWNTKAGQKSYYDMICEAILSLKDRKGTSSIAIQNYIVNNNDDIDFKGHVFRSSLKSHTSAGRLLRTKNSYKLSADEKKLALKRY